MIGGDMYYKINEDYLIHYGVLGMKWGVRKKNNKKTFNTKPSNTYVNRRSGKLISVNGINVDYSNKQHRKAAREARKEGLKYSKQYNTNLTSKKAISVMGNKFNESLSK